MAELERFAEGDDGPIAAINIIPFVDIVLVLLVIFMLTASTIAKQSLMVELPEAAHAGETPDSTIHVVVDPSGSVFVDGAPATLRELAAQVKQDQAPTVVIAADKAVDYGAVIRVIDVAKGSGAKGFALNIERPPWRQDP